MKFEGKVENTYPIGAVRPYDYVRKDNRVVLPGYGPDRTTLNSGLERYLDVNTLSAIVASNPEIVRVLKEKGLPVNIDVNSFKKNVYDHSVSTKRTAIGIYNNLPTNTKNSANIKSITDGAVLHDLGKVLIPANILTKQGRLNPHEEDVIQLHSTLSYELLKNQGVDPKVLKIVKYHHQNPAHTGYPVMPQSERFDINTQVVSLADKYSALKEKRSYKRPMSTQEALSILYNEISKGVSPDVYNALYNYAMSVPSQKQNSATLSSYLGTKNVVPQNVRGTTLYG